LVANIFLVAEGLLAGWVDGWLDG